jgi:hypothetical protein
MTTHDIPSSGTLIVNADDWGRDRQTTDRIMDCISRGSVSSTSAMVFMEDSERGADIAHSKGVDTGLHLNFTTAFTARTCPAPLLERQRNIAACLLRHSFARIFYYPWLADSFEYVISAQVEEFTRLYGVPPDRLDGHHHMHLCANVLLGRLLPAGTIARRNFSFRSGEKHLLNRYYRSLVDCSLARRHRLVDFLFALHPLEPLQRLHRIFSISRHSVVELETHPINQDEYAFLTETEFPHGINGLAVAHRFALP